MRRSFEKGFTMIIPCLRLVSVAAIGGELPVDCVSAGAFEESFGAAVRRRAEAGRW
jgi:hypothetical protein